MANSYTPEEIAKRFESLPQDIKELVYGADMMAVLQSVGAKHQLHIDQIGELEGETADVMTGFSKIEEFVSNLKESLSIDDAKAQAIAKDINDQLFVKIRESMKNLSTPATPAAAAASTPAASAAPKPQTPPPAAPPPAPSAPKPAFSQAEALLEKKTVSSPSISPVPKQNIPPPASSQPQAPAVKPPSYSVDPYREPPTT